MLARNSDNPQHKKTEKLMSNLLATKALMTTLETGAWRATKLHSAESEKVATANNVQRDVTRVTVKLSAHPALVGLNKLHAAARSEHYRLTLPAATDGFRLLPCGRELEHSKIMQKFSTDHESFVNEFLLAYDAERAAAPVRLGGLYDSRHWPASVGGRFKFLTRYMPCPDIGTWNDWLKESADEAQAELQSRLSDALRSFRDKLKDPKAIFRDTLVSNLHDICELSGDLNLMDDPVIKLVVSQAKTLTVIPADTLRNDQSKRSEIAAKAAEICASIKF